MEPMLCACGLIAVGKCTKCGKWVCQTHYHSTNPLICNDCFRADKEKQHSEFRAVQQKIGLLGAIYTFRSRKDAVPYSVAESELGLLLRRDCIREFLKFVAAYGISPQNKLGYHCYQIGYTTIRVPTRLVFPATSPEESSYAVYPLYCTTVGEFVYFPFAGKRHDKRTEQKPLIVSPHQIDWTAVTYTVLSFIQGLP